MNQKNPLQTNPFYSFSPSRQQTNTQQAFPNQNPFQRVGGPQFLFKDDISTNQIQPQAKPPLIQKGTFTQQNKFGHIVNPQQQNPFQRKNLITQPQIQQPNTQKHESEESEQSGSGSASEDENDNNKQDQKSEESEISQSNSEEEEVTEQPKEEPKNVTTKQILKMKQEEELKSYKSLAQIQRIMKDVTCVNSELDQLDKDLENSLLLSRIRFNDEISQNLSLSQCITESNLEDDNQSVFSYSKYLLEFDNYNNGGIQKLQEKLNDKKMIKTKILK